jgi:hypothetical protein
LLLRLTKIAGADNMLVQRNLTVPQSGIDNLNQLRGCTLCQSGKDGGGYNFFTLVFRIKTPSDLELARMQYQINLNAQNKNDFFFERHQ